MNHFLVKLGKTKIGQAFMPVAACVATSVYIGIEFSCHNQLRDLFCSQLPSGRRVGISSYLKALIQETHALVSEHGFNKKDEFMSFMKFPETKINWFVSSTLEPISFGSTKFVSGTLIGLPSFYNFTRPEDIPDNTYEIRRISLFRSPQDREQEERSKVKSDLMVDNKQDNDYLVVRKIDRNSPEGEEYTESLLLSDDAKKFSIARELFLVDTFRPVARITLFFMSCTLAISASRGSVIRWRLNERHISQRIPFYILSGVLGYGTYRLSSSISDQYYAQKVDKRAKDLGPAYEAGAEEYYLKRALRHKILGIN